MKGTIDVCHHNAGGQKNKQLAKISTESTDKSFHLDFTIDGEDYSFRHPTVKVRRCVNSFTKHL